MITNVIFKGKIKKGKISTLPEPAMATTPREGLEEGKERVEWTFRKKESEEEKGCELREWRFEEKRDVEVAAID